MVTFRSLSLGRRFEFVLVVFAISAGGLVAASCDTPPPGELEREVTQVGIDREVANYVITSGQFIIGSDSVVVGGHIAENTAPGTGASIGGNTRAAVGYATYAADLSIGAGSTVGDIYDYAWASHIDASVIHGNIYDLQVYASNVLTNVPRASASLFQPYPPASSAHIDLPAGTVAKICAPLGTFADITVRDNATLQLSGGTYYTERLILGNNSAVQALGPVRIVVSYSFTTAVGSKLMPTGAGMTAKDFQIDARDATFGASNRLTAILLASGSITTGSSFTGIGALHGSSVSLGTGSTLTWQDGYRTRQFPNECVDCEKTAAAVLDDHNLCTADSCDPQKGVAHAPVATGSACFDGNPCNGSERCGSNGKCLPGTPPQIGDGNPCGSGLCDPRNHQVVAGDFNGDGKADIAVLADLGGGESEISILYATGSGFNPPTTARRIGSGKLDYARATLFAGEFDGDGRTDLGVLYDRGNLTASILALLSKSYVGPPQEIWNGGLDASKTKLATGDFNGDGLTDVAGFYDLGQQTTWLTAWTMTSPPFGGGLPWSIGQAGVWKSAPGQFDWSAITVVGPGNFVTTNRPDIQKVEVMYGGGGQPSLYAFDPDALYDGGTTQTLHGPVPALLATPGFKAVATDWNGDSLGDILVLHTTDPTSYAVDFLRGPLATPTAPVRLLTQPSPGSSLNLVESKLLVGDFDGDHKADLALFYVTPDHSDSALWLMRGQGTTLAAPTQWWKSAAPGVPAMPQSTDETPCAVISSCDYYKGATTTPAPAGTPCFDGNLCHASSACDSSGVCIPGVSLSVDDGNPCTVDSCDATGLHHTPLAVGTSCGACAACDAAASCVGCPGGSICTGGSVCVPGRCDAATSCPSGFYCATGGMCASKLPNGASGPTNACQSAYAADGVCCDRACTGGCERCDISGSVGACTTVPVAARRPGRPGCPAGYLCSGTSDCPSSCIADNDCGDSYYCQPVSTCPMGLWCPPGGDAVVAGKGEPPPSTGECHLAASMGSACSRDTQCGSGFCVGGVCCDSRCDAIDDSSGTPQGCASCSLAGHLGSCTPAPIGSCSNLPLFTPSGIPPGLSSDFAEVTRFLFDAANGTQRMPDGSPLAPGVIQSERAAVIRGRALRSGQPLAGAAVSIRNHPEYGRTLTRTTGEFDLAVNGGDAVVVRIDTPNHPTLFREILTRRRDYVTLPDIYLVPYAAPKQVDLSDATRYHAVQSDVVSAGATARQMTLLFPPGARARLQLSTGTIDVAQPKLRITEYTRGDQDAAAMPATLPPTSAYTFAASFVLEPPPGVTDKRVPVTFVDAAGASISLPLYVDNFLRFPVGETAPLGGYDETNAYWQASPSGKVVRVLSVTGGVASIDTVGDGQPHDGDIALGERQMLGALFPTASNRDFLRVLLPHFSTVGDGKTHDAAIPLGERQMLAALLPMAANFALSPDPVPRSSDWDINCGYVPPDDARFPPGGTPYAGNSPDDQQCRAGSLIECQAQALGESMLVAGTPFSLVYRSDRQRSFTARRRVRVDVPPSSFPPSMLGVQLQIQVAGRLIDQYISRGAVDPSGAVFVTWDGKDAYGRAVPGETEANVRWGYVYGAVYASTSVFGSNGGGRITRSGVAATTRQTVTLWTPWHATWLASYDARSVGLRGWTLDVHHNYNVQAGVLEYGGARSRHVRGRMPWQIDTMLGGPDGKLGHIDSDILSGLALGREGAVYVTHTPSGQNHAVLREVRDGAVQTVAMTMAGAPFTIPGTYGVLTSDRDGALYLAVSGTLYRIVLTRTSGLTAGTVTVLAGQSGTCWTTPDDSGDGGPAPAAKLCDVRALAISEDGSVLVAEGQRGRIRRIAPGGTITTILGAGSVNPRTVSNGANGLFSITTGDDGSIYFVENGNWIRRITPDGLVSNVTGSGPSVPPDEDGMPAGSVQLGFVNMMWMAHDGSLYFAQNDGKLLRRIRPGGELETIGGVRTGYPKYSGDGGTAIGPTIARVMALIEGATGGVLILDAGYGSTPGIRRIGNGGPRVDASNAYVPSEDGSEIYVFDAHGRHQQTLDGKTGLPRLAFVYQNGVLSSVHEFRTATGVPLITTIDASADPVIITGPYGHQTRIYKDSDGYGSVIADAAGQQSTFSFTSTGWLSSMTDARGNQHSFVSDALGRLSRDADPAGGVQTLTPDATRTLVRVTTSEGTPAEHEVAVNGGRMIFADRFQSSETDVDRLVSTYGVENSGARSYIATDGSTLDTQLCNDPQFGSQLQTPCSITKTANNVTSHATGSVTGTCATSACGTAAACDGSNLTIVRARSEHVEINGNTYTRDYDSCPNGTAGAVETLTTESTGRQARVSYDTVGRTRSVALADTRPDALYPVRYDYDDDGRVKSLSRGTAGVDERVVEFAYHPSGSGGASGELKSITTRSNGPAADAHTLLIDGYDAVGRFGQLTLPGGGVLKLGRDASGNLSSLTPPGRPTHGMPHDALDRMSFYQPPPAPDPTVTSFGYDLDRRLKRVAAPGDIAIDVAYDARGRVKTVSHPSRSLAFSWEKGVAGSGGAAATAGYGRLLSVVDGSGAKLTFGYGSTGSTPLSATWSGGVVAGTVERSLDADDRLASESVNGQKLADFAYDGDGLLTKAGAMTIKPDIANGLLSSTTIGAVTDQRTYNRFGELATYTVTANGIVLYRVSYDDFATTRAKPRDNMGRVQRRAENVWNPATSALDASSSDYSYDAAGRLWRVFDKTGAKVEEYQYDPNGNRTVAAVNGANVTAPQIDDQDRVRVYGNESYTYTLAGARRTKSVGGVTTTYDWDGYGNLTRVIWPGTRIDYFYDAQNRRIGRRKWNTTSGVALLVDERHWLYGDQLRVVAELDGSNQVTARFVYGTRANVPDYMIRDGHTYRLVTDQVGSVRLVIDTADGTVAQRTDYADSFGTPTSSASVPIVPFGFAGGMRDRDTGLVHFGARDYDSHIGLWLTKDPAGFGGGLNLYAYVGADPINWYDADGAGFWSAVGSFVAGAATAVVAGVAVAGLLAVGGVVAGLAAVAIITTGVVLTTLSIVRLVTRKDLHGRPLSGDEMIDEGAGLAGGLLAGGVSAWGWKSGYEFELPFDACRGPNGKPARLALWGNRKGHPFGERPHYHLGIEDPNSPGNSMPNQGLKQHRPYEAGGWGIVTWIKAKF
jgi:RHS repeat-associated protein